MNSEPKISHDGHRARLKARFLSEGLDNFNAYQVLELLLFYTIPLKDTNEIAHRLIDRFGSISGVFNASPAELMKVKGISEHSSTLISMVPQLSRIYYKDLTRERPILSTSADAGAYISNFFVGRTREIFYVFCLDSSGRVIHEEKLFEGTLDEIPCYPRTILEAAFRHNAQKVIFAHNHPSGILIPSESDIQSTQNLTSIFAPLGIDVVDHIIVGRNNYLSMADMGYIKK